MLKLWKILKVKHEVVKKIHTEKTYPVSAQKPTQQWIDVTNQSLKIFWRNESVKQRKYNRGMICQNRIIMFTKFHIFSIHSLHTFSEKNTKWKLSILIPYLMKNVSSISKNRFSTDWPLVSIFFYYFSVVYVSLIKSPNHSV